MKISSALKIVLDTNIFLVSIAKKSKYNPIFEDFWQVSTRALFLLKYYTNYEEIIFTRHSKIAVEEAFELLLNASNVIRQDVYFNWNLITADPDDNKFVDIAVATNADFIVTNDKHFKILDTIDFPKVNIITAEEFLEILGNL